jgi:ABC-type bacteriocin/lantibiotic exporter with double-glycine peptidase domain
MTFHKQETAFTCGPASLRNCLLSMGYNHSERKIRTFTRTDRKNGTNEKRLFRAIKGLGFKYKVLYNRSESAFKQRVTYNIKRNNKLIILTDHEDHWISLIDYHNKYLEVIDPEEKRVKKYLTPKELAKWCLNFNKHTKETYYYGIIILNPGSSC